MDEGNGMDVERRMTAMEMQYTEQANQMQNLAQTVGRMEDKLTRMDEKLTAIRVEEHPPKQFSTSTAAATSWQDRLIGAAFGALLGGSGVGIVGAAGAEPEPKIIYVPSPPLPQAYNPDPSLTP
jgi:uncharacterized coiled-coil protein SlyX